jgi:hypothetical protein
VTAQVPRPHGGDRTASLRVFSISSSPTVIHQQGTLLHWIRLRPDNLDDTIEVGCEPKPQFHGVLPTDIRPLGAFGLCGVVLVGFEPPQLRKTITRTVSPPARQECVFTEMPACSSKEGSVHHREGGVLASLVAKGDIPQALVTVLTPPSAGPHSGPSSSSWRRGNGPLTHLFIAKLLPPFICKRLTPPPS